MGGWANSHCDKVMTTMAAMTKSVALAGAVLEGEILPPGKPGKKALARRPDSKTLTTDLQVKNAKPGVWKIGDAKGLYLRVRATSDGKAGSASYFFRFRHAGGRREMGLGSRTRVTLAEARKQASALKVERDEGHDPIEARRVERNANIAGAQAAKAKAAEKTFRDVVPAFLNTQEWKHRDARRIVLGRLERYAFPALDGLPLSEVRHAHVETAVRAALKGVGVKAKRSGKPLGGRETARRLRADIARVFTYAAARDLFPQTLPNPADAGRIATLVPLKHRGEREHFRRLPLKSAPAAYQRLVAMAPGTTVLAAGLFMILTTSRPTEALHAKWGEVDLDAKTWTIPPSRTKSARTHVVPLSSPAFDLIARQIAISGNSDWVFASPRGVWSYGCFSKAMARTIPESSLHAWRSVFADWGGELGHIDRNLREAQLAHTLGAVEGAYRRETGVEARRVALEAYAQWLDGKDSQP